MTFLVMFFEFLKTGLFAIGGGLATLPFLYDIADKYTWFDRGIIPDMIAISESTPGALGINMSTYVGFQVGMAEGGVLGGILGGFLATVGLVLPSLIVIMVLAQVLLKHKENALVQAGFYGLRPVVTGLVAYAGLQILCESLVLVETSGQSVLDLVNWKGFVMLVALVLATNFKKVNFHPVVYIGVSALLGILIF